MSTGASDRDRTALDRLRMRLRSRRDGQALRFRSAFNTRIRRGVAHRASLKYTAHYILPGHLPTAVPRATAVPCPPKCHHQSAHRSEIAVPPRWWHRRPASLPLRERQSERTSKPTGTRRSHGSCGPVRLVHMSTTLRRRNRGRPGPPPFHRCRCRASPQPRVLHPGGTDVSRHRHAEPRVRKESVVGSPSRQIPRLPTGPPSRRRPPSGAVLPDGYELGRSRLPWQMSA